MPSPNRLPVPAHPSTACTHAVPVHPRRPCVCTVHCGVDQCIPMALGGKVPKFLLRCRQQAAVGRTAWPGAGGVKTLLSGRCTNLIPRGFGHGCTCAQARRLPPPGESERAVPARTPPRHLSSCGAGATPPASSPCWDHISRCRVLTATTTNRQQVQRSTGQDHGSAEALPAASRLSAPVPAAARRSDRRPPVRPRPLAPRARACRRRRSAPGRPC